MKRLWIILMGVTLLAGFVAAGRLMAEDKPNPLKRFSAEEKQKLEKGEPIYRFIKETAADGSSGGHGEAYVIINVPAKKCYDMFIKFEEMPEYIPRKTKSKVVKKEGEDKVWVEKEFDFYVTDIGYTFLYKLFPAQYRLEFYLDKNYPHDIEYSEGYYQFEPLDDKRCLFVYAPTKVDTGVSAPDFIANYLTSKDLPGVVKNVKLRMESGGKWKKD